MGKTSRQVGRIKKGGEREPNGRLLRTKQEGIPMGAMMQRVKGLGLSGAVSPVAAALLCGDQEAGTALGRLMWDYQADGTRKRRMMAAKKPLTARLDHKIKTSHVPLPVVPSLRPAIPHGRALFWSTPKNYTKKGPRFLA